MLSKKNIERKKYFYIFKILIKLIRIIIIIKHILDFSINFIISKLLIFISATKKYLIKVILKIKQFSFIFNIPSLINFFSVLKIYS